MSHLNNDFNGRYARIAILHTEFWVLSLVASLFGRLSSVFDLKPTGLASITAGSQSAVIRPDRPFCAIGDIHGRLDLLEEIYTEIRQLFGFDLPLIFLGDYVDRGPDTAGALQFLFETYTDSPDTHLCLMGNHEKMLLDFISDPLDRGKRWLKYGGDMTLKSYGITGITSDSGSDDLLEASEALERSMPTGTLSWIENMYKSWSSGNMHCVHAAMDPQLSVQDQSDRVLLWGHREFMTQPRNDDQTVVNGHTVVRNPEIARGRISIDTGAFQTGRLTGAYIDTERCEFFTTGS